VTTAGYAPVTVEVFFDLTVTGNTEGYFIIGESLIGGTDVLSGEVATDITEYVYEVNTSRGRSRELDTIQTGVATVRLRNYDARFLPDEWNASTPFPDQIVPGKRVRIAMAANSEPIFDGRIDEWHYEYSPTGEVDAWFDAIDALGSLASMSFDDWDSTASQTPGERINDVLDRAEVDWGPNRSIGDGVATLASDAVSWGSNVLNYISLCAATDRGFFFAFAGEPPREAFSEAHRGLLFGPLDVNRDSRASTSGDSSPDQHPAGLRDAATVCRSARGACSCWRR
jgi:hypothetical protein